MDTPEKFEKAITSSDTVRNIAGRLAWDARSGTGTGRFMLVPAFQRPTDAWEFVKAGQNVGPDPDNPMNLLRDPPPGVTEAIARYSAGLWANEVGYTGACLCGMSEHYIEGNRGYAKHGVPSGLCPVHPEKE